MNIWRCESFELLGQHFYPLFIHIYGTKIPQKLRTTGANDVSSVYLGVRSLPCKNFVCDLFLVAVVGSSNPGSSKLPYRNKLYYRFCPAKCQIFKVRGPHPIPLMSRPWLAPHSSEFWGPGWKTCTHALLLRDVSSTTRIKYELYSHLWRLFSRFTPFLYGGILLPLLR